MVDSPHPEIVLFPYSDMFPYIILRKNCPIKSNADFV